MPKRAAVIDVGTNSIKLLVAEKKGNSFRTLAERVKVARLGGGLSKSGCLSEEAMWRAETTIARMAVLVRKYRVDETGVFGTHAIREAANGECFAARIKERTGVELKTLSGDEEARYSFAASTLVIGKKRRTLVFDAGGGSTEFILGINGRPELSQSVPVGSLTLFDECMAESDPPSASAFIEAERLALKIFANADKVSREARKKDFLLVGIGGIISVLASVAMKLEKFCRDEINGRKLTRTEIEEQIKLYGSMRLEQRKKIPGLPATRAQVAPAGAVLALAALKYAGKDYIIVSACGLRHGAMLELLKK